jgi:hypothetical protein
MNWQEAYLAQARSDWTTYRILQQHADVGAHDELHYLQMASEKLAKAALLASGVELAEVRTTHRVVVKCLRVLRHCGPLQRAYGLDNDAWRQMLGSLAPAADSIELLCPALAGSGPNTEYPWSTVDGGEAIAPCRHAWRPDPRQNRRTIRLLALLDLLLRDFERLFG